MAANIIYCDILYPVGGINLELLREEIAAAAAIVPKPWSVNKMLVGGKQYVRLAFIDTAPTLGKCQQVIDAHNPAGKTAAQLAAEKVALAKTALAAVDTAGTISNTALQALVTTARGY